MEEEKKDQEDPGRGIQIHYKKGPIQMQAFNQSQVGWRGPVLDD